MAQTPGTWPYSFTSGSMDVGSNVDSGNIQTLWSNMVNHWARHFSPLGILEGPPGSNAPIKRIEDLAVRGGKTWTENIMHPFVTDPQKMDFDTHTYELPFTFDSQSFNIIAWRRTWLITELQKLYPNFPLKENCMRELVNYRTLMDAKEGLCTLQGINWTGANSSGTLHTGVTCTNQVYAGHNSNISQLSPTHKFTVELASIAKAIGEQGERRSGDPTFIFKRPTVGGREYSGVCLLHPRARHNIRFSDSEWKTVMLNTQPRSDNTVYQRGIQDMFVFDDILFVTLAGYVANFLTFSADDVIKDENNVSYTAPCDGVCSIFLGGEAAIHLTGFTDWTFRGEGWDNDWFTRMTTGAVSGMGRTRIAHPTATIIPNGETEAVRDMGTVLIYSADANPNSVVAN